MWKGGLKFESRVTYQDVTIITIHFRMRYSLGDLNPKRDPSPEQKRNDHLGDSGIALSANGDEDGRSAVSRASTANTEVSFFTIRDGLIASTKYHKRFFIILEFETISYSKIRTRPNLYYGFCDTWLSSWCWVWFSIIFCTDPNPTNTPTCWTNQMRCFSTTSTCQTITAT